MLTLVILLTGIGILLLISEFILPGGVLGVLAFILLITSLILALFSDDFTLGTRALISSGILLCTIVSIFLWMKFLGKTPLGSGLILHTKIGEAKRQEKWSKLLHCQGTAQTDLNPSGKALIDGKKMDVLAETQFIAIHKPILVTKVNGPSIFVREIEENESLNS